MIGRPEGIGVAPEQCVNLANARCRISGADAPSDFRDSLDVQVERVGLRSCEARYNCGHLLSQGWLSGELAFVGRSRTERHSRVAGC